MVPNNLPLQLSSFIGREREIQELTRLLATSRLVTLTGAGGVGKTRLALRLATEVLDTHKDGVRFIELAPIADSALIVPSVASVFGLREQPGQPLPALLAGYLCSRDLLLVMDNCEHLIEACAQLVAAWLQSCPQLRILATSRESLNIEGEVAHVVPPLSSPRAAHAQPSEEIAGYEAVRLFATRAQAAQPRFALSDANTQAVTRICDRLAGIPLAIELAAARMGAMSVAEIAARLDDVFPLLVGGRRTALPRQQTLQATLDWSFGLLSEPERVAGMPCPATCPH